MFERQRFRGQGAHATWTEEPGNGDKQVNGEDEEFAPGCYENPGITRIEFMVATCKTGIANMPSLSCSLAQA
jgi:hypothetical protein